MNTFKTKDNRNFSIREPQESDAENIIAFVKIIFSNSDQIVTTSQEFTNTVDQQKVWIKKHIENPTSIILIAELDNQIVGLLDFSTKQRMKINHAGEFGISVHPDFQEKGIGRNLTESLLKWATETDGIEKVVLNVFVTNLRAIRLYESLGFIEEGRHIKAVKQPTGEYVDLIEMYKFVK